MMDPYIKEEFKRRMESESLMRINTCLDLMSDHSIWYTPNEKVNSVGNLILHLCGNIHQYVLSTLGNYEDTRNRDEEFLQGHSFSIKELREKINWVITESVKVVDQINGDDLTKMHSVQCFEERGISILIHVIEHTSYHTGQITQMCKWVHNIDTQYYPDLDLNQTN